LLFWCFISPLRAQDLEPRFLSSIPIGGNFAIASYGYSTGNILLDNTLPIEDLNAKLNSFVFAYARSFKLFNKLAKFDVVTPYSFGYFEGVVSEINSSKSSNGLGDPMLRFSVILVGSKPLLVNEFLKYKEKKFKFGVTARLKLPLGQYDSTKLINLGANRWAFKFGVAASYSIRKKLILEGHLNSWFFNENKAFFNGNTIEQKPLLSGQIHITYVFKPGIWTAISIGSSALGETIINELEQNDLQNNTRFGLAFAYKMNMNNALKIAFTSGLTTRYGADFTSILIAYQFMWFDKT
jgi:hypothetical protein